MKLSEKYNKYMLEFDSIKAHILECKYGLTGYTQDIVSVALAAIDVGEDPTEAIIKYTGGVY